LKKRRRKRKGSEYEIEKILGHEKRKGQDFFNVKWKGYAYKDNSWEPASGLTSASEAVLTYKKLWNLQNPKDAFILDESKETSGVKRVRFNGIVPRSVPCVSLGHSGRS
jgi:hypothetical protein